MSVHNYAHALLYCAEQAGREAEKLQRFCHLACLSLLDWATVWTDSNRARMLALITLTGMSLC